ncbi:MAG TPA: glutathione S-transferase N-terminal domain-containing protein [Alphaproteobacteria bacterium]|jgi:GST-like protein|nr:glutathione S-transferase N-terminal domain-containing protein [Alphaproteobacteria bacterium]MDP7641778.1 glutathione S-transferase N-terminal domain-containing protein [Alphaproteobacteria bacterium]HJN59904.1 glutathione S-transferase N-terminal domain-containing protein [Alphaproteobacteria bacterium]
MLELYYWPTPNGWKITILLEELGLDYKVIAVDILRGEQYAPEFIALNPNSKIPVLVDSDSGPDGEAVTLFESGAIMLYLAEKTGRFFAATTRGKYDVLQWLMFQIGGVGPFFGQANHFNRYASEQVPYAIARYTGEASRLLGVMERQLDGKQWIAGGYSIADMALFGWVRDYAKDDEILQPYGNVADWFARLLERPAVRRGLAVLAETRTAPSEFDATARAVMFGDQTATEGKETK